MGIVFVLFHDDDGVQGNDDLMGQFGVALETDRELFKIIVGQIENEGFSAKQRETLFSVVDKCFLDLFYHC